MYGTRRTAGSEDLEWQLRDIWLKGTSLPDKIQTREAVLDDMRGYNEALAAYAANQKAEANVRNCEFYASRLGNRGIIVSGTPPFSPIPPLSMRLEVDAERVAH
jgi:hypothetical protein